MILGGFCCIVLFIAVVPPYKRGFHCKDLTIRLPFKPNTVSVPLLMLLCHGFPSLIVIIYEYLVINVDSQINTPFKTRIKQLLKSATAVNVEYTIGLYIELILVFIIKSISGVLRPHFIEVCKPNFESIDCTLNEGYITEFKCTAEESPQLKYARESFPSGHASSCAYAWCFLLMYTYSARRRLQNNYDKFSASIVAGFAAWGVYVCFTRVADHWHHANDVYGGIVLGSFIAIVMFSRKASALLKS